MFPAYLDGNRQKSSVEKSPWNKKSLKKSPTILTLYFLGLFFGSSVILYKKVPEKKSSYRKMHRNKGCLQPWKKRDLILKTPLAIFNMHNMLK